ncbi:MAG: PDZ domain-containing protein, partial [Deltaproteobacteria bacterium]|nr:PDZ domain-containing protein [Deltaproteobacteria bacterium]
MRSSALGAAIALLLASATFTTSAQSMELTCERIPGLLNTFLHKHIRYRHLDDGLRTRAIDSYIKRLDSSKTLYTSGEAEVLKTSLKGIFFDVGSGECANLEEIQKDIVGRYIKMKEFVETYVRSDDYEIDPEIELVIDPDKRARPKNLEQQHALFRKLVQFQMSNYLSTDISVDEAKDKLVHRYELSVKRAEEFDTEDVYSLFLDAFASALDPHSNYMSDENNEDFKIQMGLSLIGIGVGLSSRDGYSVVEKVIPGGAADKVGELRPKDKVIAVAQDGEDPVDVIDMDLRKVVRLIRGKRHTVVHLTILRQSPTTERFVVSIERDKINL